jgi:hypothetical protein
LTFFSRSVEGFSISKDKPVVLHFSRLSFLVIDARVLFLSDDASLGVNCQTRLSTQDILSQVNFHVKFPVEPGVK